MSIWIRYAKNLTCLWHTYTALISFHTSTFSVRSTLVRGKTAVPMHSSRENWSKSKSWIRAVCRWMSGSGISKTNSSLNSGQIVLRWTLLCSILVEFGTTEIWRYQLGIWRNVIWCIWFLYEIDNIYINWLWSPPVNEKKGLKPRW